MLTKETLLQELALSILRERRAKSPELILNDGRDPISVLVQRFCMNILVRENQANKEENFNLVARKHSDTAGTMAGKIYGNESDWGLTAPKESMTAESVFMKDVVARALDLAEQGSDRERRRAIKLEVYTEAIDLMRSNLTPVHSDLQALLKGLVALHVRCSTDPESVNFSARSSKESLLRLLGMRDRYFLAPNADLVTRILTDSEELADSKIWIESHLDKTAAPTEWGAINQAIADLEVSRLLQHEQDFNVQ